MSSLAIIGGGVALYAGLEAMRLNRMKNELIVESSPRLKVPPTVGILIRNPTGGRASIVQPQVAIYASEAMQKERVPIVASETSSREIEIKPFGQVEFDIPFRIPIAQVPGILRQIRGGKVIIETTTTIRILGGLLSVPYTKIERMGLGNVPVQPATRAEAVAQIRQAQLDILQARDNYTAKRDQLLAAGGGYGVQNWLIVGDAFVHQTDQTLNGQMRALNTQFFRDMRTLGNQRNALLRAASAQFGVSPGQLLREAGFN